MTDEKRDPPIEEQPYISGVRVVDIGDYRVARGMTRRAHSACPHIHLVYDQRERRVWCKDCEHDVEPFDAFVSLVAGFDLANRRLAAREERVTEAESHSLISIAAKAMDHAWRSRKMVPACPHCKMGLLPELFKSGGLAMLGRDYAEAQIKRRAELKGGDSGHG